MKSPASLLLFSYLACLTAALPTANSNAVPGLVERDPSPEPFSCIDLANCLEDVKRSASPDPLIPAEAAGAAVLQPCWTTLSCSFAQIQGSSMPTRLAYVRYMQANHLYKLGAPNKFRAIEGVIEFFMKHNLGAPGTWVSYVDTGIVEAIQRGGAIALGMSSATGNNPGSAKWADYFRQLKAGQLNSRDAHDPVWSRSEQAATEYGKARGDAVARPTQQQLRWYQFTQLFRAIMRNRSAIIWTIRLTFWWNNPALALGAELFIDWLTDVTSDVPTLIGGEIAWNLSAFDIPFGDNLLNDAQFLIKVLPSLWNGYQQHK